MVINYYIIINEMFLYECNDKIRLMKMSWKIIKKNYQNNILYYKNK